MNSDYVYITAIALTITLFHIFIFKFAYSNGESEGWILIRGIVAGLTANYLAAIYSAVFWHPWLIALLLYGLIFTVPFSVIITLILYEINDYYKFHEGFWLRLLFGLCLGSLIGIICGLIVGGLKNGEHWHDESVSQTRAIFFTMFLLVGAFSGIMSRVKNEDCILLHLPAKRYYPKIQRAVK